MPVFQRRYTWERERQWEPFWGDVLEVVEAYVEAAQSLGAAPRGDELPVHFLGAIVVKLVPFGAGQLELREVIDGQQRLTTIQLLIGAAASALGQLGAAEQADVLRDLIENRPYLTKGQPDSIFKVWPTKHDRAAFRAVMSDRARTNHSRGIGSFRLSVSFENAVSEWAVGIPEGDRELHLQALEAVVRAQLHIVWIDLDDRDNAQVIFETLNDRGAPLNAIDLVKNLVFQHQYGGDEAKSFTNSIGRGSKMTGGSTRSASADSTAYRRMSSSSTGSRCGSPRRSTPITSSSPSRKCWRPMRPT